MAIEPITAGIMAGAGLAAKAYGGVQSYRNQRKLEGQLRDLQKTPMAKFEIDPKIEKLYSQSMSEASSPIGYDAATLSNFRSSLARNLRSRYKNAMNISGGSGARGVNAVLAGQELDALGKYAAGDESMKRQSRLGALNRGMSLASQFQNVRDRNTSFNQNYRLMVERALGEGIQRQRDYRNNLISGAGSDLISAGIGYGDFGNKI